MHMGPLSLLLPFKLASSCTNLILGDEFGMMNFHQFVMNWVYFLKLTIFFKKNYASSNGYD